MNYSIVFTIVGYALKFEGLFLLLPMGISIIYKENNFYWYLLVAILAFLLGSLLTLNKISNKKMYAKEGLLSVALSWIVMSIFGAVPFVLTGDIPNYIDALFETVSGFTTTGASILSEVESLNHSALFWRSFTHWIGGMGVIVFIMAILPLTGGSSMNLMKAESPGPSVDKLVPRVKDTARVLYLIYIFLTLAEIIILLCLKMPVFDAVATTVGTVGTGGFGIKNDSLAGYSSAIQITVGIFMLLSGVNFSAYFLIITRKFKAAFKMEEVRWYLILIFTATLIIVINTRSYYDNLFDNIKDAFFQVSSITSSTGFSTANFDVWPSLSKTVLVTCMFIGACAGSTGGGIKVSRFLIFAKNIKKELSLMAHQREIKKIRIDGHLISHDTVRSTNVYLTIYMFIYIISLLIISADNFSFTTNFTAIVATINNIGPGLDAVGPACNFGSFSILSKLVLIFDMLAGRLELFPIMIMFHHSVWKK